MTEPSGHPLPPRRRLSTRATTIKVTAASLTAAMALTGGLAIQMASGHDPALGSGATARSSAAKAAPSPNAANAPPQPATVVTRSS